jgi:hypothetical protein
MDTISLGNLSSEHSCSLFNIWYISLHLIQRHARSIARMRAYAHFSLITPNHAVMHYTYQTPMPYYCMWHGAPKKSFGWLQWLIFLDSRHRLYDEYWRQTLDDNGWYVHQKVIQTLWQSLYSKWRKVGVRLLYGCCITIVVWNNCHYKHPTSYSWQWPSDTQSIRYTFKKRMSPFCQQEQHCC